MVLFIERDIWRSESMFKQAQANKCRRTIHRNYQRTDVLWCQQRPVWLGNVLTIAISWFSLGWQQNNFDVMNVTLDSPMGYVLEVNFEYSQHVHDAYPIYRFVQCARNHPASKRRSSSQYCIIKNVTSYIIAICSNVLVTISALQRSIVYCTN